MVTNCESHKHNQNMFYLHFIFSLFPSLSGHVTLPAMIGPSLIPIVNYMGSEMIVMPLIIMGILLIFGGLASFFLPETKNKSLPQTIYDSDSVPLVNPFNVFTSRRHPTTKTTKENVQICDVCKLETRNANQ